MATQINDRTYMKLDLFLSDLDFFEVGIPFFVN